LNNSLAIQLPAFNIGGKVSLRIHSNHLGAPLVAPLASFDRFGLALAGGKGANLGELSRAGFEVPPGFVVTTAAYDLLLENNGLASEIHNLLANLDLADPVSVSQTSRQIQDAFQQASIPTQVSDEILSAYRQMGGEAVAVRSSATAEDLPGAAFAGQQETFLNVVNERTLLEAVQACWASLWSERAVPYRLHQKVEQATVKLAVVVQRMVPADAAGVMFTANPLSGARDKLLIDANPGLGEAVVGGLVTPDHLVVDKRSFHIQERRPGRREIIVRSKSGGGIEQIAPAGQRDEMPALPTSAIQKLAKLGLQIERHYGAPQDIEWAWIDDTTSSGKLFILQARPVTALPEPVKMSGPMRMVIPMLAEMWPERPYPLDSTTFTGTVEGAIADLLVMLLGSRAPSPHRAFIEEDGVVVRFTPPEFHPTPALLVAPWIALWRTRRYDPLYWQADPLLAEVVAQARALEKLDLHALSWAQNVEAMQAGLALIPRIMQLRQRYLPRALLGLAVLWLLLRMMGRGDRFGALVSGVETKTTETNRVLESLAAQIRTDPQLQNLFIQRDADELRSSLERLQVGKDFLGRFDAFLDQYGHRETSLTISQPAWKDRPEIVLGLLKVLAVTEPHTAESYQAWRRARDELLAHSSLGRWPLRKIFLKSLALARAVFQIREDTHFYATLPQPLIRHIAIELGRRLLQAGVLAAWQDVFHLRLAELEPLGEPWPPAGETLDQIRALVARRKARRAALAGQPVFDPRWLASEPAELVGVDVLLSGAAASPGRASGPARIIRNTSEFGKLQPGDVLVAPVTNPAWTPLFQRAAAVVVDTGGSASHVAIVAREYGIPAVMGTGNGTQKLVDGQLIRVDGSKGLIFAE
jgi:phosphohistidine swiveling domain-containing protein